MRPEAPRCGAGRMPGAAIEKLGMAEKVVPMPPTTRMGAVPLHPHVRLFARVVR